MDQAQLERYRTLLSAQLTELLAQGEETLDELETKSTAVPDITDRASLESESGFDLRLRDRDRKLISKIRDAIERIDQGRFGVCEECGSPIEERRLLARPVTSQCIDCKQDAERRETGGR